MPASTGTGGNGDKDGYAGVPGVDTGGDAPEHEFRRREDAVSRRRREECSTEVVACCCCCCCWDALGDGNL